MPSTSTSTSTSTQPDVARSGVSCQTLRCCKCQSILGFALSPAVPVTAPLFCSFCASRVAVGGAQCGSRRWRRIAQHIADLCLSDGPMRAKHGAFDRLVRFIDNVCPLEET